MPDADDDFWSRVERSVQLIPVATAVSPATDPDQDTPETKAKKKRRRRRLRRLLDLVSALVWTYGVAQLFVADVAGRALGSFSPYRPLIALGLVFVLVVALRANFILLVGYAFFFPFILLFWHLPWFFYRRKSWLPVVATINLVLLLGQSFLRKFAMTCLLIITTAGLVFSSNRLVVTSCISCQMSTVALWYLRAIWASLHPSALSRLQKRALSKVIESEPVRLISKVGLEMKEQQIELFTQADLNTFSTQMSMSIVANRALYFWAYQLQRYRRSSAALATALAQYVLLLFGTVCSLSLSNRALLRVSPTQYQVVGQAPGLARVVLYSVATMALNAAAGIDAIGERASLLRLAAGLFGPVLLLGLVVTVLVSFRLNREDSEADETIRMLKQRAAEQEGRMRDYFNVSVPEAIQRLNSIGANMTFLFGFLLTSIPEDFMRDAPAD